MPPKDRKASVRKSGGPGAKKAAPKAARPPRAPASREPKRPAPAPEPQVEVVPEEQEGVELEVVPPEVEGEGEVEVEEPEKEEASPVARAFSPAPFDPVTQYFQTIRHYPILSREEEKELGVRYLESQDLDSAYRLVTSNLRLVVKISLEYRRAWREIMDLIQEGNMGLMQAVKKYDPYRGVRFSSYAAWWIRAYILRYIINNVRMVKLGTTQAQRTLFFQLGRERERLRRMGIEPDAKALAEGLGVKESEVVEMSQRLSGGDVSLDAPRGDGEDLTLMDALPSHTPDAEELVGDAQARALYLEKLASFVASLSERDRRIFKARWMRDDPVTLQEMGEELGITRERVRQLEARLLERLREYLESEGLAASDFLK